MCGLCSIGEQPYRRRVNWADAAAGVKLPRAEPGAMIELVIPPVRTFPIALWYLDCALVSLAVALEP